MPQTKERRETPEPGAAFPNTGCDKAVEACFAKLTLAASNEQCLPGNGPPARLPRVASRLAVPNEPWLPRDERRPGICLAGQEGNPLESSSRMLVAEAPAGCEPESN